VQLMPAPARWGTLQHDRRLRYRRFGGQIRQSTLDFGPGIAHATPYYTAAITNRGPKIRARVAGVCRLVPDDLNGDAYQPCNREVRSFSVDMHARSKVAEQVPPLSGDVLTWSIGKVLDRCAPPMAPILQPVSASQAFCRSFASRQVDL